MLGTTDQFSRQTFSRPILPGQLLRRVPAYQGNRPGVRSGLLGRQDSLQVLGVFGFAIKSVVKRFQPFVLPGFAGHAGLKYDKF